MNILVTGGASGLGEAITCQLARAGNNHVYFTYSKSFSNAQNIEERFPNTTSVKCDFRNPAEINALIDAIHVYDIDILVNNAYCGKFINTYFHKTDSADFLTDFRENVMPVIEVTQSVLALFRKKKSGKIITILTAALNSASPIGSAVYVANKAYLQKLTKVWATENAKFNITSNSVSPSFMQTALTSSTDERIVEEIRNANPLKKILTVEEVAEIVVFLVNASPHINGLDIIVNSGANFN